MKPIFSALLLMMPLASAYSGDRMPTVYLAHFYVVLDQASYDALRSSPLVAALAGVDDLHTVAGTQAWTGFYLWGHETYMEFFGSVPPPDQKVVPGDTGLGLTVEESGGVAAVAARLSTVFGKRVKVEATPRTTPSGVIPWFTSTQITSQGHEVMETWFMEIAPGYLAAMHPGAQIENPLSRQQYLAWRFLPDRPLDNVVGLAVALNPSDMAQLATELELVGWAVNRAGGGFVATGPDVKLTVVPAGARAGIQQAELRLRRPVPKQEITLGSAKLLLEGETGRFVFWASN
jgi:hypothetical protein